MGQQRAAPPVPTGATGGRGPAQKFGSTHRLLPMPPSMHPCQDNPHKFALIRRHAGAADLVFRVSDAFKKPRSNP